MQRVVGNAAVANSMQSKYTKENLYDLDSDEDELDFLRKDIDETARARERERQRVDARADADKKFSGE